MDECTCVNVNNNNSDNSNNDENNNDESSIIDIDSSNLSDLIDTLDFPSQLSIVSANTDSNSIQQQQYHHHHPKQQQQQLLNEDNSYTLSCFSLGDVEDYLREDAETQQQSSYSQNNSMNTEDDDIAKELKNLQELEEQLAVELKDAEKKSTPDRRR
jgi:hypothetical protein